MSSIAVADLRDRLVAVAAQVGDAALDDRERRPQLVARVGGELALAAHRVADRDERAVGVQPPDDERCPDGRRARRARAPTSTTVSVRCSSARSPDDLDDERALRRGDRQRQNAPAGARRRVCSPTTSRPVGRGGGDVVVVDERADRRVEGEGLAAAEDLAVRPS